MSLAILTLLGHSVNNFQRLYRELRPHVDQWVVVHDGPENHVSGATNVRAPEGAWDFSMMRNVGLEQVTTTWVLHLDSDEWLTSLQLIAVLDLMQRMDPEADCLHLPRRNVTHDGDWLGWPDMRPVIHRSGLRWAGAVEEWPQGARMHVKVEADPSLAILHLQLDPEARAKTNKRREEVNFRK